MKKLFLLFALALLSLQACKNETTNTQDLGNIVLISPQQVYDAVHSDDSIQLVDVRTKEEYNERHLKGAQNICVTDDDFREKVKTLDKNKPVYVYCKMGGRSADAADKLKEMGFTKVYDMEGGITSWEEKKLKIEK